VAWYTSESDIQEIGLLMNDIRSGRISRNKNYFTLAEVQAWNRFRRAKLLMSLVDDLNRTAAVAGNEIKVDRRVPLIEIKLYNPGLKYRRIVTITEAELNLIKSQIPLT